MNSLKVEEKHVTSIQFKEFQKDLKGEFKEIREIIKDIRGTLKQHTFALLSIENTMKIYGDMYQMNKDSLDKLTIRVEKLENA